jgi:hypothetical protein
VYTGKNGEWELKQMLYTTLKVASPTINQEVDTMQTSINRVGKKLAECTSNSISLSL